MVESSLIIGVKKVLDTLCVEGSDKPFVASGCGVWVLGGEAELTMKWLVLSRFPSLRGRATNGRAHNALVTFTRDSRLRAASRRFSPVLCTVPEPCTYCSDLPRD